MSSNKNAARAVIEIDLDEARSAADNEVAKIKQEGAVSGGFGGSSQSSDEVFPSHIFNMLG
jgi:hypothetical protein